MINDMLRKIAVASVCATLACAPAEPETSDSARDTIQAPDTRGVVLFLGTSLTAGYGLGAAYAFPALIQQKIDSAGYPLRVVNAGLSGETSAGGLRRLDWTLQNPVEILVIELGANDGLRGLAVADLRDNLEAIIERTRARYPDADIVMAGMEAPPNLGVKYTSKFRETFRELAAEHDAALVPFLLDGVAALPELNQEDGIHPNAKGQERVAANVWSVLEPVIRQRLALPAPAATK